MYTNELPIKHYETHLDDSMNENSILLLDYDDIDCHVFRKPDWSAIVTSKADLQSTKIVSSDLFVVQRSTIISTKSFHLDLLTLKTP